MSHKLQRGQLEKAGPTGEAGRDRWRKASKNGAMLYVFRSHSVDSPLTERVKNLSVAHVTQGDWGTPFRTSPSFRLASSSPRMLQFVYCRLNQNDLGEGRRSRSEQRRCQ